MRVFWSLAILGCSGGGDADELRSEAVQAGLGELRRMHETGAAPLNACRGRLQDAVQRVGRGPVVGSLAKVGPMLCLTQGTFVDCATSWQGRFTDVCGHTGFDAITSPINSKPGDGKRFLADMAAARLTYKAAVAAAATATPTALYREDCRWVKDGSGIQVGYEDVKSGRVSTLGTATCDVELTTLDAALTPTATILASATVGAAAGGASVDSVDLANREAMEAAAQRSRAALLGKVQRTSIPTTAP